MKKLFQYLKKYTKECILGPLFKLFEASFELIVPLVVARMIDVDIAASDKGGAARDGVILIVLGIFGLLFSVTAQYFSAKAAVGVASDMRHSLFARIQSLSYSDIDETGTASLITRMTSDINTLQNGINMALRLFLRSPFIVFGAAAMAFALCACGGGDGDGGAPGGDKLRPNGNRPGTARRNSGGGDSRRPGARPGDSGH